MVKKKEALEIEVVGIEAMKVIKSAMAMVKVKVKLQVEVDVDLEVNMEKATVEMGMVVNPVEIEAASPVVAMVVAMSVVMME